MKRMLITVLAIAAMAVPIAQAAPQAKGKPNIVVADGEPSGGFELVGTEPLMMRGMNAALAVHKGFAYVGNRTDGLHPFAGVAIVDVRDPSAPTMVGEIGQPYEGNVGETSREMRVWPQQNLLIVLNLASNCTTYIHACSPTQLVGQDNYRFFDISDPASPKFVAEYQPTKNPHEFFLWVDPKDSERALLFQSTPSSGTEFFVTDISKAKDGKFKEIADFKTLIPTPDTDNRIHSLTLSTDGTRAQVAALGGGYLEVDTSEVVAGKKDPQIRLITDMEKHPYWGDPGAHSTVKFPGRDYVLTTDEVYGYVPGLLDAHGCPWGWVRIIDINDHKFPKVISEFKLPQNTQEFCDSPADNDPVRNSTSSFAAHNPTLTSNLALITWHSGGLQALDISDPAAPQQAAQYLPEPLPAVLQEDPALSSGHDKVVMWSFPVVYKGLIYVVDLRNGLYILKYNGPFEDELSKTKFLEGNSNLGDALRFEKP